MINKKQIFIFIVAIAILAFFVILGFRKSETKINTEQNTAGQQIVNPSLEVGKNTITEKNEYYTINAVYPKTNSDAITKYFKDYVEEQIAQFKKDTSWVTEIDSSSKGDLSFDIDYKSVPSVLVQNYIFTLNSYTGGAHGMQVRKTFSFNKDGQLLTISNLFKNSTDDFPVFARLVQKELLKREGANSEWIADGAGPKEENYQAFVVTDNGITILFDPYQVAPWSDGAIDINISIQNFSSIANPEIFLQ
jgi:Protein of unknown function (DUF3298)